jgi:diketogulonate reductase-like aldo/keto reductase
VLRWHVQLGSIPLPKSGDASRQRENFDVFSFELSEAEMTAISSLERGRLRAQFDPNTHEEF